MDIIVIGNGFDLAHRLPTKYDDFLKWVVAQVEFFEFFQLRNVEITKNISMHLAVPESCKNKMKIFICIEQQEELWKCISDNVWIGYFLQCEMYERENWVDFEKEISDVIQTIDTDMQKAGYSENRIVDTISVTYFADYFLDNLEPINEVWNEEMNQALEIEKNKGGNWSIGDEAEFVKRYEKNHPKELKKEKITYKQLISRLEEDLTKLIRALEIYLTTYF